MIKDLNKIENERKYVLLKYIAIICLSQKESNKLKTLKNTLYNKDVITNVINECQCDALIKNAEQFLKEINIGNL